MNNRNNLPPGFFPVMIAILCVVLLIGCVVYFLYVKNLRDTLNAVRPQNRKMPPAQVWLLLISLLGIFVLIPGIITAWVTMGLYKGDFTVTPAVLKGLSVTQYVVSIFILAWHFKIVTKIADSIAQEYASRNMQVEARPAYQTGLIYCICSATALVISLFALKWLGMIVSIASFIFWIMYWIKTAEYKKALKAMPSSPEEDSSIFQDLY